MGENSNTIPAVEKTVALLEYLGRSNSGVSQAELCDELDITQSTCYRILQTLLENGWISKGKGNLYDVAPGMAMVTEKLSDVTKYFEKLQPLLEQLAEKTGLSCKLSIRRGDEQETLLRAESPLPMGISGKIGVRFPIIEGSVGAVLLRDCPESELIALGKRCKTDICERSNIDIILERIKKIKQNGYCCTEKFTRWNAEAMSAPVMDAGGKVVAAVTLLGFANDFVAEKMANVAAALVKTAKDCSKIL